MDKQKKMEIYFYYVDSYIHSFAERLIVHKRKFAEINRTLKKAGNNLNDREIMEEIDKAISAAMDKQIFSCLGAERREPKDLDCDPISNLKEMIARNTTVILCHPNAKKQIEEYDLPPMTKIFTNPYIKEGAVYVITDTKMKRSFIEYAEMRKETEE